MSSVVIICTFQYQFTYNHPMGMRNISILSLMRYLDKVNLLKLIWYIAPILPLKANNTIQLSLNANIKD